MTKVMLLTGASRGIGRAIAKEAQARGWTLSLGLRDPRLPEGVSPDTAEALAYDATARSEAGWVSGVMARHGRIDAVVACAGVLPLKSILTDDEDTVQQLFEVNVHAPRRLAAAAWEPLKAAGAGRIAIIASLSGKRVKSTGSALYSVSKFAAVGLAHALRHEGWADGIRATAICPGLVNTEMGANASGGAFPPEAMTQPADLARLTLDAMDYPGTLSQAEITVNCQVDGIY